MNIENHHAYVRMLANGTPTKPFDIRTFAPEASDPSRIEELLMRSAEIYGEPRRKVEMDIRARYHM